VACRRGAAAVVVLAGLTAYPQVLTTQYDNARTGATLSETILTPANVNVTQFGKVFTLKVDGDLYAQPLYVPHVEVPDKGTHNLLFVATEHDSVYAFDADHAGEPLWRVSFLNPDHGVTAVPAHDVRCPFIRPEVGITPTPVIDIQSGTLYVLARTKENPGVLSQARYVQKLHALAITTGAEKFGGPVEIKASVKGGGAGASGGELAFDGLRELPRAGLLLSAGNVFLTWGSSCDVAPYHGWVMAYDAHSLAQTGVYNTSPDAGESGIWQSDNGPAADAQGNVYLATGNGRFTAATGGRDYGDSLLKLGLGPRGMEVRDFFTPAHQKEMNASDLDLGSGGPVLLPDQPGPHPHLLLVGGKDGSLYLLDRDRPGKFQEQDRGAVQRLQFPNIYSAPAYWNGHIFVQAERDYLKDFPLVQGRLAETPAAVSGQRMGNPGATPAISANGARNGIVWMIETKAWNGADRNAVLHAYDAANVAHELYTSEQNATRDRVGLTLRFTIPTIAAGRVYVEAKGEVDVYGVLK
jgi:hypothetical protein